MNAEISRPVKTVWFMAVFGVFLPLVALAVESAFRVLGDSFFDPVPTVYHGLLIAMVPLANAVLALSLVLERPLLPRLFPWFQAAAMGISLLYAIMFLPVTPFAPIAIIWFGIGFLPLAPLLSLIAAMLGRKAYKRMHGAPLPFLWRGMLLTLALFIGADAPATLTRVGLHMATAEAPQTRQVGVRWLRVLGNDGVMLRYCHGRSGMIGGFFGSLLELHSHIDPEQARKVFYQVTGTTFNSNPAPKMRALGNWRDAFDGDRGGAAVGQRNDGVGLASSRIDGSVDANAALGYLEWTMVFKNSSAQNQEARAELLLPAGAVVSRATLWIAGEEHEAAFGGRNQVRQAYEKIVRQNRDPLLVTTAGRDRVLVQLFPVPPGGDMKIRIGMTAPMTMRHLHRARLALPSLSERNFDIDPALRHAVWVESSSALEGGAGLRSEQPSERLFALRGELADPAAGHIEAARQQLVQAVWGPDDKGGGEKIIVQTLAERPVASPRRVAVVIDGSLSMRAAQGQLADALAALPGALEVAYVFAGDGPAVVTVQQRGDALASRRYLQGLDFVGGRDNGAALAAAWDWAAASPSGAIVWIHGGQPDLDDSAASLQQRYDRRPAQVTLYDVQAEAGPNAVARKLDGVAALRRVERVGSLGDDLRQLFGQWAPGATEVVAERLRQPAGGLERAGKTSPHLARLWAAGQIAALSARQHDAAVLLAARYQLVTPVSGAVVLETQQQYDEAGLQPVAPGSVPSVPEPETWLLIIVALGVLGLRLRKRAA